MEEFNMSDFSQHNGVFKSHSLFFSIAQEAHWKCVKSYWI